MKLLFAVINSKFLLNRIFSRTFSLGLCCVALGVFLGISIIFDDSGILIQSRESKTADGSPIFNEIVYQPGLSKDFWMMKQSHFGKDHPKSNWDRIAIVIDKSKKQAKFFQLQPGPLVWSEHLKPIEFKVSCYICHANGPRAIRPDFEQFRVSLWDQVRVAAWNLRIKAYGKLDSSLSDSKVPFRLPGKHANEVLKLRVCAQCHKESGFLARGELTKQHEMPIRFMIENGLMPPLGIKLSKKEKADIYKFL